MARLRVREVAQPKGISMNKPARRADLNIITVRRLWRDELLRRLLDPFTPFKECSTSFCTALGYDKEQYKQQENKKQGYNTSWINTPAIARKEVDIVRGCV